MLQIRTTRLPAPYGECLQDSTGGADFYYKTNFSVEGCFRSCLQKGIYDKCGCYDPRYATLGDSTAYCVTKDSKLSIVCIDTNRNS